MFYFRWLADGTTVFDAEDDAVQDEDIFAFRLTQAEGQDAFLELQVENPNVGPLAPGREVWARMSYAPNDDLDAIQPIFHGRLQGMPEDLQGRLVTFSFRARKSNYDALKEALAATLRVDPFFDPIWFSPEDQKNPDTVLEGISKLFVTDRVTNAVTVSDIISGEDGTLVFNAGDIHELNIEKGTTTLKAIDVTGKVQWKQYGRGEIPLTTKYRQAFAVAGSDNGQITTYTGEGYEKDLPLPGASIGGGWNFGFVDHKLLSGNGVTPTFVTLKVTPQPTEEDPDPDPYDALVYLWVFACSALTVVWNGSRDRIETVKFRLRADVQNLVADVEDDRVEEMQFDSSDVALPVDPGGVIPIGDVRRNSYFNTDRGRRSINWLISAARARLRAAARAVEISAAVSFDDALAATLRKDATFNYPKIPGGTATGKITSYELAQSSPGVNTGSITIGCTIGHGGTIDDADLGDPVYVEEGYVEPGYQKYEGVVYDPYADEVTYPDYRKVIVDDGLHMIDLNEDNCLSGRRAEASLTLTGLPTAGQTVTIGDRVYTWRASIDELDAPGEVLIGSTIPQCVFHLGAAINALSSVKDIFFADETEPHADVVSSTVANPAVLRVRARTGGTDQNSIAVSTTASATWNHATLVGGTPDGTGLFVINGENSQRDALEDGAPYTDTESIEAILDHDITGYTRVELNLKPIEAKEPFQTDFKVLPSLLKVPKTIDLEAV